MTTQEVKRKLVAILSADMKGYSRLMGEDEEGTLGTLTAYRETMAELILGHRGRVVNAPGVPYLQSLTFQLKLGEIE